MILIIDKCKVMCYNAVKDKQGAAQMNPTSGKKMRFSRQRESIYEYLCGTKSHPSAEMIYEELRDELPNLSLGTVYRNLRQLEELGMVMRVTTVDNRERYDACCEDHVHFVCGTCGQVVDMTDIQMEHIRSVCGMPDGATLGHISVVLGGTCAGCAGK